jgi:hypothetical protein
VREQRVILEETASADFLRYQWNGLKLNHHRAGRRGMG